MPEIVEIKCGADKYGTDCSKGYEPVACLEDLLHLIDRHMGKDFCRCLEEMLSEKYAEDAERIALEEEMSRELDQIRDYYHSVLCDLRELSEELAGLIQSARLDRRKISTVAGAIGKKTWEEL